jgi:hypothetical protein
MRDWFPTGRAWAVTSNTLPVACPAFACTALAYARVLNGELVPVQAVIALAIRTIENKPAVRVLGLGDGLEVCRVHAVLVSASTLVDMINGQAVRDWTYKQLVGDSMNSTVSPANRPVSCLNPAIAVRSDIAGPQQATCRFVPLGPIQERTGFDVVRCDDHSEPPSL